MKYAGPENVTLPVRKAVAETFAARIVMEPGTEAKAGFIEALLDGGQLRA